ncbi:MAG TPA: helix-turn-helix domain-containing protein [Agromyces sp.]
MPSTASPRANRGPAAAAENRQALIRAAREVYADGGFTAPFSAVAKRAGVGQGSLYRHFPDRTSLAVAVFDENVADLDEYVSEPDRTIDDLLDRIVEQAVVATALIGFIAAADPEDPRVRPLRERFEALVSRLVTREREAGRIGSHIETADVTMAVGMLSTELARADAAARPAVAARARALFHAAFAPR